MLGKIKGGKYAPFGDRHFYQNELLGICDVTQQIYLDMKPWGVWINEKFEQRRKTAKRNRRTVRKQECRFLRVR